MSRSMPWLVVSLCLLTVSSQWAGLADDELPFAEEEAIRAAVSRVAASVVRIETLATSEAGLAQGAEANPASGPSTGVVVQDGGLVVTTSFCVPRDVDQAIVVVPSAGEPEAGAAGAPQVAARRRAARVVGRDLARGLVLLRMDQAAAEQPNPPAIAEWVPRDALAVGQWTIAVGRGWNTTAPSVAVGILSAVNRSWGRSVQTDASVSPANYGGPLVDIHGRVIGILAPLPADTAGMNLGTELYDSGIGFAVPYADLVAILPRLEKGETLVPGVLGIGYSSRDSFTGEPRIATVRPGSPAAKAGLRAGDLIVAAEGRPIARIAEFRHVISPRYAGDVLRLSVERMSGNQAEGKQAEGKQAAEAATAPARIDTQVELVAALPPWRRPILGIVPARSAGRDPRPAPVKVSWLWAEGPAARAGVVAGDEIEAVVPTAGEGDAAESGDPVKVTSATMLAGIVAGSDPGRPLGLVVSRDGERRTIRVESMVMPGDLPAGIADQPPPPAAGADPGGEGAVVERLEAAEVAQPPMAVVPQVGPREPLGVLVFLDVPRGRLDEAAAAEWKAVAARYGVAVILPESTDPRRWGREDVVAIRRALATLASKRAIDPARIAVAGRGAGGAFAWLVGDALGPAVRGIAMVDATLPRQAAIEPAEPGRSRWVLFANSGAADGPPESRLEADRRRLEEAGITAGMVTQGPEAGPLAAWLAAWVEALGVL